MKVEINNITLKYIREGKGDPVILLHGNGEDHRIFDKLTAKLKDHFTVYAIDSRNHGESEKTDDFSYETMAEDIFQFIRKLQLQPVSLIGFSDGAIVGLLMATGHKDVVRKMALLGVNLKPTDFKKGFYRYIAEEYAKTKDPLTGMMLEQPNIELKDLKNISVPTLVVAGQYDLFYRRMFKNITDAMPNAMLKIMRGHDHDSYINHSDILYPDLKEFLDK